MQLLSINTYPGKDYEVIGIVTGSIINTKNFVKDFFSDVKSLVGGELKEYTKMMDEARQIAIKRMVDEAETNGADAIINIRIASSAITTGAAEILVYGTAIKFKN